VRLKQLEINAATFIQFILQHTPATGQSDTVM